MSRFQFRLDRVLTLREQAERSKAQDLGLARRRAEEQGDRVDAARARVEQASEGEEAGARTSAGALHLRNRVREAAHEALAAEAERQRAAEEQARQAEARYHEARRDRKSLERLRARQADEHELESSRDEQKTIDEIALRRGAGEGGQA